MGKKTVLLFHIGGEKQEMIRSFCQARGIQVFFIKKKQYGERLGVLAGIVGISKTNKPYRGEEFPGEMMVFSGIDSDELDVFLEDYRLAGIEAVALKAVLTPANVTWTPEELYRELLKEHKFYHS